MMFLSSILIFLIIDTVSSRSCGFHNHAELHYRKHHRVITNESKPFLHFTYEDKNEDGPSHWPSYCNSGHLQSPIAYDSVHPIHASHQHPLKLIGAYKTLPKEVHVINSGHGETFSFVYEDNAVPQITGGPLHDDIYNFASFHFHYPCEHRALKYKNRCNLELHFVHYNSKYVTLENAIDKPDGLAVIGLLFEETEWGHPLRSLPFLNMLHHVYEPDSDYTETKHVFSYADALGFWAVPKVVSYKGSLTTPGCAESVTWIVVDHLFLISEHDMNKFYKVRDHEGLRIKRNNRPIQPINGRKIHIYNDL
ncbi:carbonic anhydrase 1-like [Chironomus tepperi]|uniref:carbonic anhydrase 1-like n=1 Tax=Chironomus tepperi TaxID=113505 RepID=UPI00391F1E2E